MEILLILSLSVMLSSLIYGSQRDTVGVAPRERVVDKLVLREGAFGIIIAFVLFVIIIGLPIK